MSFNRDKAILSLRPEIPSIELAKNVSKAELFQNKTLRPILKSQNILIHFLFKTKLKDIGFKKLDIADQRYRITQVLENNIVLRNQFIGLVIGMMTSQEIEVYLELESEIKRRIKTMLVERLIIK